MEFFDSKTSDEVNNMNEYIYRTSHMKNVDQSTRETEALA